MKTNRITLKFIGKDEPLEKQFLRDFFQNSLKINRFSLFLGIAFYAAFGLLDALLLPTLKQWLWLIRFGLVCPILLLGFAVSFAPWFEKYWQGIFSLMIVISGLGIIGMIILAQEPINYYYYAGLMLVLFYCYTFIRIRFIWAAATCWMITFCYEVTALWITSTPTAILINNNFFFISANLIGMLSCYSTEVSARKKFYLFNLLANEKDKVAEANKNLRHTIAELQEAAARIKTLSGLLPICSHCKKIRDDQGYWNQLESYLGRHSQIEFSHSLCPECSKILYPFLDLELK